MVKCFNSIQVLERTYVTFQVLKKEPLKINKKFVNLSTESFHQRPIY